LVNDADFDLLIGNADGDVLMALNVGDQQTPDFIDGGPVQLSGQGLTLTADSAPAVVDWDGDGKKDLLVGCASGVIGLYINTGTDESPEFTQERFVETESGQLVVPTGNSVVFVTDWNGDGLGDLLVGSGGGQINLYLNVGAPGAPVLRSEGVVTYVFNKKKQREANPGMYSTPYLADWNGDGLRDLVSGNEAGEIVAFEGIQPGN